MRSIRQTSQACAAATAQVRGIHMEERIMGIKSSSRNRHADGASARAWVRRAGLAGFLFFLAKGLLWVGAPAILYVLN